VNFCFRPKKDSLQFTMAGQWRRGDFLSSCERGFFRGRGEAAVQLRASPSGRALHFNQRPGSPGEGLVCGAGAGGPRPRPPRWPGLPLRQVRPGDVTAGVDWRSQLPWGVSPDSQGWWWPRLCHSRTLVGHSSGIQGPADTRERH
jgi:hypothetical protein